MRREAGQLLLNSAKVLPALNGLISQRPSDDGVCRAKEGGGAAFHPASC